MVLAGGLFAASQTIGANLMTQMKTQSMVTAKIATAILGVLLNLGGAYWWGTIGVVGAAVIFSTFQFFWLALLVKN
jgi:hypothetical protein